MKIKDLHIKAYGHFTNFPLVFDDTKSFHLIYGPNEAGKSTLLRSISDFLYGIPNATRDNFLHKNSDLRIEGTIINSDGVFKNYARRKGNKNTLLNEKNEAVNEMEMITQLFHLSRENFEHMFGINHERIRQGSESLLESGGNAGEGIFSAASGTSLISNVKEELEKVTGEKFKKSGSKPVINRLLSDIKTLTKEMAQLELNGERWSELEHAYEMAQQEVRELEEKKHVLRLQLVKLQRIKKNLPDVKEMEQVQVQISQLADYPKLTPALMEQKELIEQELSDIVNQLTYYTKQLREGQQELGILVFNEEVLTHSASIEQLYRQSDRIQSDSEKYEKICGDIQRTQELLQSSLVENEGKVSSFDIVENYRISYGLKSEIHNQMENGQLVENAIEKLKNELHKLEQEIALNQQQITSYEAIGDMQSLQNIIEELNKMGDLDDLYDSSVKAYEDTKLKMEQSFSKVSLWDGTAKSLYALKISILDESITLYRERFATCDSEEKGFKQKIEEYYNKLAIYQGKMKELEQQGEIPTIEQLSNIRHERDEKWTSIKKHLQGEEMLLEDMVAQSFENMLEKSDKVSDFMIENGQAVADKKHCLQQMEDITIQLEKEQLALQKNEDLKKEYVVQWNQLWSVYGIQPLTPREMEEWKRLYNHFMESMELHSKAKQQKVEAEEKRTTYTHLLAASLMELGIDVSDLPLRLLKERAQQAVNQVRDKKARLLQLKETQSKNELEKMNTQREYDGYHQKYEAWLTTWRELLDKASISLAESSPKTVQQILQQREKCLHEYDELMRFEEEKHKLEHFIQEKEKQVETLRYLVEDGKSLHETIHDLYSLLINERAIKLKYTQIKENMEKVEKEYNQFVARQTDLESEMLMLVQASGFETTEQLQMGIEQNKKRIQMQEKIDELVNRMIQDDRSFSLEELIEEALSYDRDALSIELQDIEQQFNEVEQALTSQLQVFGAQEKEYKEKIQGDNAAYTEKMVQKENLVAELEREINEYTTYRLAASLLQKGIEYYREQNQHPILTRSSELFCNLTNGNYVRVESDYNANDDRVIVGVRHDGTKVQITGMSDGTQDQLYLSLRIAGLEQFINQNGPLPFIVDDILVHFDDARSKVTIKELIHLSKETQLIFFTHHEHIVELVKEVMTEMDEDCCQFMEVTTKEQNIEVIR